MTDLVPYLPEDRCRAIASGVASPDRAHGTALFADISGFTQLTETLVKELGPKRGTEELSRQINAIYDALVIEVQQRRGAIISFAGDAITCWFDSSDADAPQRAAGAAFAMQAVMRRFERVLTPSGAVISMAMKVSLASGGARRFVVGDPRIQRIDTVAGATIQRMATGEHHATRGEVVVDVATANALAELLDISDWRRDDETGDDFGLARNLRLEADALTAPPVAAHIESERLVEWVFPELYERLSQGSEAYLPELRPVVSMFMRFSGIEYDLDDDAGKKLDDYVTWAQRITSRFGGTLLSVIIGDKGSYAYMAFGAPVAHEDDTARALAAALELVRTPREFDFARPPQIGVTRGRAFTGAYGARSRKSYSALGDEVNTAARLMSAAGPGQILVTQRVIDAANRTHQDVFDFAAVGSLPMKGKAGLVAAFAVSRREGAAIVAPAERGAMLGRERELDAFRRAFDDAREGRGQVLNVSGAAGIGKTAFAKECAQRALQLGAQVLAGRGPGLGSEAPYAPWREMRALTNSFLVLDEADGSAALDPHARQQALIASVLATLAELGAAGRPVTVMIDDAQRMDEASQALALAVARAARDHPILFVLVWRGAPGEGFELGAQAQVIELGLLDKAASFALIEQQLGHPASTLAKDLIHARAQGNPFAVLELARVLRETDGLRLDAYRWALSRPVVDALERARCLTATDDANDPWQLAPNAPLSDVELNLPESVEGVVLARVDRLSPLPRLTIKAASVIGLMFTQELLARTHPSQPSAEALDAALVWLQRDTFITASADSDDRGEFAFHDALVQEVAYDTLLETQQRELHHAIAQALEQLAPGAITTIAFHAYRGQDWPRAWEHLRLSGEVSQALFANRQALDYFSRALQSAERAGLLEARKADVLDVRARLGELFVTTGQYESALTQLDDALALADALNDADTQAFVCRWHARLRELRGEFDLALEWIERGFAALGGRETNEAAEMLMIAGLIFSRRGQQDDAISRARDAQRIGGQLRNNVVSARAHNLLGQALRVSGRYPEAIAEFSEALAEYAQASHIGGQALALNQLGTAYHHWGQLPQAIEPYRRARRLFSETGDLYNRSFVDNNLGDIARMQGRLDDALTHLQSAVNDQVQIGASPYVVGVMRMNLGATFARRGDVDEALTNLREAERLFEESRGRDFLPELYRVFAEVALQQHDAEAARTRAQRSLEVAGELSQHGDEASALRVLAAVALTVGEIDEADRYIRLSADTQAQSGSDLERARTQLVAGRILRARGDAAGAKIELTASIAVFERIGAALDVDEARAVLASLG